MSSGLGRRGRRWRQAEDEMLDTMRGRIGEKRSSSNKSSGREEEADWAANDTVYLNM